MPFQYETRWPTSVIIATQNNKLSMNHTFNLFVILQITASAVTHNFDECDHLCWKAKDDCAVMWNNESVYQYNGMWIVSYSVNEQLAGNSMKSDIKWVTCLYCKERRRRKKKNGISCKVSKFPFHVMCNLISLTALPPILTISRENHSNYLKCWMWLWIWCSIPAHARDITQLTHQGATLFILEQSAS